MKKKYPAKKDRCEINEEMRTKLKHLGHNPVGTLFSVPHHSHILSIISSRRNL